MGDLDERRTREAVLSGSRSAHAPRAEIAASWRRMAAVGLDPGGGPEVTPLTEAELERRRATSGLAPLVPGLMRSLLPVIDAGQLVVVADVEGRVLWRSGTSAVRRMADHLGFVGGSAWTEGNVGTNAIGTALVLGRPVQIRGGEHYVESHTRWGCAAAPLADPWTGRPLGVVDVSGPSRSLHPAEMALVEMAARLASIELLEQHRVLLDRLRTHSAPLLAAVPGAALVVDPDGHIAAAKGLSSPDRVLLPADMTVGDVRLPHLGPVVADALPGGWLLRVAGQDEHQTTSVVVNLAGRPEIQVSGLGGGWTHRLTPRHAEILVSVLEAGAAGRSAAELADDLFADRERVVTVRAEVSRLRRVLGSVLLAQPYRLAPQVVASLVLPPDRSALLPGSDAPVVMALRR